MPEASVLRSGLRSMAEFDSGGVDVVRGLRCAAGVTVVLAIGIATGHPADGGAAAVGALSCGFASFQGVYGSRVAAVLMAGVAMAVASFAAAWLHRWAAADVILLSVFALAAGQLVALGQAASVVGLQAVVAVIVLGQITLSASVAGERAAWVLGGALVQGLLVVAFWPVARYGAERRALATAYGSLAAYARDLPRRPLVLPDPTTMPAAAATIADSLHRFGLATLTLASQLDAPGRGPLPELWPLAASIRVELDELADRLDGAGTEPRGPGPSAELPRPLHDALSDALSSEGVDRVMAATVLELTDAMVDSAGTAADALPSSLRVHAPGFTGRDFA